MKSFISTIAAPITFPVALVLLGVAGSTDSHYASVREGAADVLRTIAFLICAPFAIAGFFALVGINRIVHGTSGLN